MCNANCKLHKKNLCNGLFADSHFALYNLMTFRSIFDNKMHNVFNEGKKSAKLENSMKWCKKRTKWDLGITTTMNNDDEV